MGSRLKMGRPRSITFLSFILIITSLVVSVRSQKYMEIRMMYGMTTAEGAVFMFKDDQWWPICDEAWTITEAEIACRQLGYPYPYAESNVLPDYIELNVSRGMYWLDGFQCGGYESQLKWCRGGDWGYCTSGRAAGVTCHTVSESDLFESRYLWPIAMLIFACFMVFACCKKANEQHRMRAEMQTTAINLEESSESDESSPYQAESQVDHEVLHHYSTFNGGNLKNATYITLPHVLQGLMPDVQEENVLILTGLHRNLPSNQDWDVPGPPTAPPPDLTPSYAYQTPDSSPQQGASYYPSQDPALQDAHPPPPSYEEATRLDQ